MTEQQITKLIVDLTGALLVVEAVIGTTLAVRAVPRVPRPSRVPMVMTAVAMVSIGILAVLVSCGILVAASEQGMYAVRGVLILLTGVPSWVMLAMDRGKTSR